MKWENVVHQSDSNFKRLVGVSKEIFAQMVEVAEASEPASTHPHTGRKRGPKPRLANYLRICMAAG